VVATSAGSVLNPVNSSIIAVALVAIGRSFGVGAAAVTWLVSALYLATAIGQPAMGRLADQAGPRRVYLAGLALVAAGYRWGDPVAGLAITLFICHVGYEVTRDMLARLMDGLDPGDLDAAQTAAAAVPGIRSAAVRGRWMGRTLLLEVETRLDGSMPLADADQISRQVEAAVIRAVPAAGLVHSDAHA